MTSRKTKTVLLAAFFGLGLAVILLPSCSKDKNTAAKMTLYDSLGGATMVADPANAGQMIEHGRLNLRSVVDSAIFVIAGDSKINGYFMTLIAEVSAKPPVYTGFNELSKNLTDFFCVATGAKNFSYTGLSMHDAHNHTTNPRITNTVTSTDFDNFVGDVVTGAQKNGVSSMLIGQVGAVIYSVESVVVQR